MIARNPGPPSGSLRTVGTTEPAVNLRIANAQASGETGDFWDEDQTYNTGVVRYTPSYNLYTSPPDTVYENTVLYNRFPSGDLTLANQTFIDGTEISLVLLNGTLSETSTRSATVDVRAESGSTQTVTLDDDGSPITITFASTRSADYWTFLENTQSSVTDVRPAGSVNGLSLVTVELDDSQSYQVQLTKVGVGTGVTDEDTAYLTDISGDGRPVSQGESIALTLEVRDRFNNPPDNATTMQVTAEVAGSGSLQSTTQTPDEDGQVTFVYEATGTTGDQEIRFSHVGIDSDFDATTPQDVSMTVDVTSGSGGGDGTAPAFSSGPTASPSTVTAGTNFDLTATLDDVGNGGTDITGTSWSDGQGNSGTFTADDGEFDQPTESVSDTGIDTTGWDAGDHTITVTGTDGNENTASATVTVTIEDSESSPPSVSSLTVESTGTGMGSSQNVNGLDFDYEFTDESGISTVTTTASNSDIETVSDTQNAGGARRMRTRHP
ncbi:hypothetical protein ACFQH8_17690 [Halomicroarcula sp. GCM10025710]